MADPSQTKSEAASPRKREKMREQGQLAISSDLATALFLLATFQLLSFTTQAMGSELIRLVSKDLPAAVHQTHWTETETINLAWSSGTFLIRAALAVLLGSAVIAILANVLQIGFQITPQALELKSSRLSPSKGAQKIFSIRAVVRSGMAMTKFVASCGATAAACYTSLPTFFKPAESLSSEVVNAWSFSLYVGTMVALALVVVSVFDYAFQRFQHEQEARMTKQEVKDENKENEGDGNIKAKMRKHQRESLKQREELKSVTDATVVVTNPTHFAVALKYDRVRMATPVVVAKGTDHRAQQIKRIAAESGVPTLERREVARALYASTQPGQAIPETLFRAVAEIIAHVYALKG